MDMQIFLTKLNASPENIDFKETIAVIDAYYEFTPTEFRNGDLVNEAGQNSGSCKLLAFAQLQGLTEAQTLYCFGEYYRIDVLKHPEAKDHQNIRNFIKHGWQGVRFSGNPLTRKP